ncbi:MAG: hypothetical protein JW837_18840 [Sedimentisphaerales bacterium]|nr:hypothetical protein [Sedimentisphaerales bacterium]
MTYAEAVKLVIRIVLEIQEISDKKTIRVSERTIPIGGLPGFDSMSGVDLAAMVDAEINIGAVGNLCASQDGKRALSISEIANRILEITSK